VISVARPASRNEDFLDLVIKLDVPEAKEEDTLPPTRGAAFKMSFTKHRGIRPDLPVLKLELMEDLDGTFGWVQSRRSEQLGFGQRRCELTLTRHTQRELQLKPLLET
jgi:hypothetical protein